MWRLKGRWVASIYLQSSACLPTCQRSSICIRAGWHPRGWLCQTEIPRLSFRLKAKGWNGRKWRRTCVRLQSYTVRATRTQSRTATCDCGPPKLWNTCAAVRWTCAGRRSSLSVGPCRFYLDTAKISWTVDCGLVGLLKNRSVQNDNILYYRYYVFSCAGDMTSSKWIIFVVVDNFGVNILNYYKYNIICSTTTKYNIIL